ncbi:hypothetical protein KAJ27_00420, partial [bacterium]|nr:hypothetical protein [bacterium]
PMSQSKLKSILLFVLAGIPFFIFCASSHVCICGHLRHSPTMFAYLNDFIWTGCFVYAGYLLFNMGPKAFKKYAFLMFFLPVSRIVLQGFGGLLFPVDLLILIFIISILFYYKHPVGHSTKQDEVSVVQRKRLLSRIIFADLLIIVILVLMAKFFLFSNRNLTKTNIMAGPVQRVFEVGMPYEKKIELKKFTGIRFLMPNNKEYAVYAWSNAKNGEPIWSSLYELPLDDYLSSSEIPDKVIKKPEMGIIRKGIYRQKDYYFNLTDVYQDKEKIQVIVSIENIKR